MFKEYYDLIRLRKACSETTSHLSEIVSENMQKLEKPKQNPVLDLSQVDETTRLAFYGALFAIAAADGHIDKEEMELIFGMMDLENMSEDATRQVQSYVINPPLLWDCLRKLSHADERLRYSVMINLVDTAWANDELDPNEEKAILLAQQELEVTDEQLQAIKAFIQKESAKPN